MMFTGTLPPQPIPLCVIGLVIVTASTDIVRRRIPNPIILAGLIAALIAQGCLNGPLTGVANWLAGAVTGFTLLLPFYLLRGMAAGDVKLLTMIGAWVGPMLTIQIALTTFLLGGIWSLIIIVQRSRTRQHFARFLRIAGRALHLGPQAAAIELQQTGSVGSIPYGVAIAA
jgi:prepilin peptidase CpaA